jgi:hypothetical protein
MKYVGFDWASQAHDVTVLDEAGQVLDRWAFPHSEVGWLMTVDRLRRQGLPDELPVIVERASGLVVDRLLSRRAIRWCRCSPPRSSPPGRGGVPPGRNPIRGIVTGSLTTCAPTRIGCGDWHRLILVCSSYRCWSVSAMITSGRGQRHATSSRPCWMRIGLGRDSCSSRSCRRSSVSSLLCKAVGFGHRWGLIRSG